MFTCAADTPGVWTELGAKHVGVMQSLIVTCRLHQIDPYDYLVDVLQRVGQHPIRQTGFTNSRRDFGNHSSPEIPSVRPCIRSGRRQVRRVLTGYVPVSVGSDAPDHWPRTNSSGEYARKNHAGAWHLSSVGVRGSSSPLFWDGTHAGHREVLTMNNRLRVIAGKLPRSGFTAKRFSSTTKLTCRF